MNRVHRTPDPRTATAVLVAAAVVLVAAPAAEAQDYTVLGTVEAEGVLRWAELAEPATTLRLPLEARLTHTIAGDAFDLTARTVVATAPPGDATQPGDGLAALAAQSDAAGGPLTLRLPELSLSAYPTSRLTTRVGRFDLDWGSGYFFSPGSSLAPTATGGAGVTGASFTVIPSTAVTLGAAASLEEPAPTSTSAPWQEIVGAAWVDGYGAGIDWFAGFQYEHERITRPSLALSVDLAGTILAVDAAVELAKRYEYPSGGTSFEPREDPAPLLAVAAQRSLGGRSVSAGITAEYLYTALGHTADEADEFYDLVLDGPLAIPAVAAAGSGTLPAAESAANELAPLGRHYVAVDLSFEWYDTLAASAFGLVNASDGSLAARTELALLGLAPLEFYARWAVAWGPSRRSELGLAGTLSEVALGSRISF